MTSSSTTPAMRNIPPYSTVRRIRMVGRSHGPDDSAGRGSQVGLGGAAGGGGAVGGGGAMGCGGTGGGAACSTDDAAEDCRAGGVGPDPGPAQAGRPRDARTAPQRPYRRGQLTEGEGLGEVVVGAQLQTLDAVAHIARGGEHQNACGQAHVDELAA